MDEYFEIPSSSRCIHADEPSCGADRECRWISSVLGGKFGTCTQVPSSESIRTAARVLSDIVTTSHATMGYAPTVDDIEMMVRVNSANPMFAGGSTVFRVLRGEFRTALDRFFALLNEWRGGGGGSCSLMMRPGGELVATTITPGDVIDVGFHNNGATGCGVLFSTLLFLGEVSAEQLGGQGEDTFMAAVLLDGEVVEGCVDFIKTHARGVASAYGTEDEGTRFGRVRIVDLGEYMNGSCCSRLVNIATDTRRSVQEAFNIALHCIGLYTFQIDRGLVHHFALYVSTGGWVNPEFEEWRRQIADGVVRNGPGEQSDDEGGSVWSKYSMRGRMFREYTHLTEQIAACGLQERYMHAELSLMSRWGCVDPNLTATVRGDIESIASAVSVHRASMGEFERELVDGARDFVIVISRRKVGGGGKMYACWDREALSRELMRQYEDAGGEEGVNVVLRYPPTGERVDPKSFAIITGVARGNIARPTGEGVPTVKVMPIGEGMKLHIEGLAATNPVDSTQAIEE